MAQISYAESMRETQLLQDAIDHAPDDDAVVPALEAALAHPCAPHQMQVDELWTDIVQEHRRVGRHDEAIAADAAARPS